MNLDATIRAVQAKLGVTVDGNPGPKTWDAIHRAIVGEPPQSEGRVLLPSEPEWRFLKVYREGDEIVVPDAIATVFGWDTALGIRDPDDNGECSSGKSTKDHPGLMGCALPVSEARRSTRGSAFPKVPGLPWLTKVVVARGGKTITVELVDNGPSAPPPNDPEPAGIDLTPAACLALGASLEDIRRNRVAFKVSFRLPGAGKYVQG